MPPASTQLACLQPDKARFPFTQREAPADPSQSEKIPQFTKPGKPPVSLGDNGLRQGNRPLNTQLRITPE
jgi:hypothetical protein